jgi:hypothetical protein
MSPVEKRVPQILTHNVQVQTPSITLYYLITTILSPSEIKPNITHKPIPHRTLSRGGYSKDPKLKVEELSIPTVVLISI